MRPFLADLTIYQQVADGAPVTTRKTISGTHTGLLMGIPPTGRFVNIVVIDIARIEKGKYMEHWGLNTLNAVLMQLGK